MSQCQEVLALLQDGPKSTREILNEVPCIVHSRIADLRKQGHTIICERRPGHTGAEAYAYRLIAGQCPPADERAATDAPVSVAARPLQLTLGEAA